MRIPAFGAFASVVLAAAVAQGATGVILADGSGAGDADRGSVARGLERGADTLQSLSLPAVGEAWLSTLRLSPCTEASSAVDLNAIVTAARQQITMLAAEEAEVALEQAIRTLPCAESPVPTADLLAAFEVLGEAAQVAGHEGNARFAYEGLLAVEPGYTLTSPPGTGYEELYNTVRRSFVNQAQSTVGVRHGLAGGVYWDGAAVDPATRVPLTVLAGRHLLQWDAGSGLVGAWVELPAGGEAASLVWGPDRTALLAGGLADAGATAAIAPMLRAVATEAGVDGVAVLPQAGATSGYLVTMEGTQPWASASVAVGRAMAPDRVRLAVGAGYANLQLTHYGDITAAVDVRLVGPLHVRIEGDLALSQPLDGRTEGYADQGSVAVLPGVGAGIVVHPVRGLIQPFGALTAGVWIGAKDEDAAAALDAALAATGRTMSDVDRAKFDARHAVDFRGFIDGGMDAVPLGGPLVIRVSAGVGLGMALTPDAPVGFQFRAGAAVGLRLGAGRRAKGG